MTTLNTKLVSGALALSLTVMSGLSLAKGSDSNEQRATERFDYIFTQLALTDAEQREVLSLLQQTRLEAREMMKEQREAWKDSGERPEREEMKEIREATRAAQSQIITDQLNTVLSPEVTSEFMEYVEAHRGMHRDSDRDNGRRGERQDKQDESSEDVS